MTTETAPQLDQAKAEQFAGQMVGLLNNAFTGFMVSIGHRSGLFDVMATLPPSPGTTRCRSKPKARHSQSMALGASW